MAYPAEKIITPKGTLMWVDISGVGVPDFNGKEKQYQCAIVLAEKDCEEIIKTADRLYEENHKPDRTKRACGYVRCDEKGKADENGSYFIITFKTKTLYPDGNPRDVKVFDSKANQVDLGDLKVGNGTVGSIAGQVVYYISKKEDGTSFWLNAIQIINLVEYKDSSGFSVVEGESNFTDPENPFGFRGNQVSKEKKDEDPVIPKL